MSFTIDNVTSENNMPGSNQLHNDLGKYETRLDDEIERIFSSCPSYEMYDHLSYFMGFKNEKLQSEKVYAGKKFRSNLTLLLADFYDNVDEVLPSAVSIELFHNFTLVHDDIVDGDTLRRGRPTVWKLFGINHAINDGDSQLLLSLESVMNSDKLSSDQKISIQRFLIIQYKRVIEGQFLDFTMAEMNLGDEKLSEKMYTEMIGRKTSDLIATATYVAGLTKGVSSKELQSLYDYGYQIGLVYQICDDMISIWGKETQTGKRECGDIIEKKKTLPILSLYQNLSEEEKKKMRGLYNVNGDMSKQNVSEVLSLLDTNGAYEAIMDRVEEEVIKAKSAVDKLSFDKNQKQILLDIVDMLHVDIKNV